jgi:hypothetical protein
MYKSIFTLIILSLAVILSWTISAHAFRCGNEIVSRWDSSASVLSKCGNPFTKSWGYQNIDGKKTYVEKWFYNCGENDFIYSVSIHEGTVVYIDSVQRGKGKGKCQ